MSDESPWGAPPPSNPYGPPQPSQPQPPHQATPPYPQAGGGGYGGNQPPYGSYGGPGGPGGPSPKKKTGLIVGIVVAVLVVVAAFVVTIVVTSGDGDDEPDEARSSDTGGASDTTDPTDTESTESTESTEPTTPTDPTESGSTAPDVPEGTIAGDGYTFELPVGWADVTAETDGVAGGQYIDVVVALGSSLAQSQSNVIIEALSAGPADEPEDLANLWKRNLASDDKPTITDNAGTTIDGERAIGVSIDGRSNAAGLPITQLCYLVLHDGQQYSIGLSFPKEDDDVSESDLEAMFDSWTWS